MKCIIAEDEAVAARRMQKLLANHQLEVLRVCKSIQDIQEAIVELGEPDLYFFDIHLNDGLVFQVFEKLTLRSPVIFTTAYDQYAIKAFKQNSIDYLLKPIDKLELKNAIEKFKTQRTDRKTNPDLEALSQMLLGQIHPKSYKERLSVKIGDRIKSIKINDVPIFYSKDKINYLYNDEKRSYPIDSSLDDLEKSLDPSEFFRINRSAIVNINFIQDVYSYSNSRLKLTINLFDLEELIVARDRVKAFKDWLG